MFSAYRGASKVRVLSADPINYFEYTNCLRDMVILPEERASAMEDELQTFVFAIPKVGSRSEDSTCLAWRLPSQ